MAVTKHDRHMPRQFSVSLLLIILMAAVLAGVAAWMTAARISAGNQETLEVIMYPDQRLREIAAPVQDAGQDQERISRLFELMRNTLVRTGAGALSAPEVGVPERIVVIRTGIAVPLDGGGFLCMVNPRIIDGQGTSTEVEGCLSFPRGDWKTEVSRFVTVTVQYLTPEGQEAQAELEGADARLAQHGIDHLDGVLVGDLAERGPLKARLVAAASIYLLALVIAIAWYIRRRVRNGRERT